MNGNVSELKLVTVGLNIFLFGNLALFPLFIFLPFQIVFSHNTGCSFLDFKSILYMLE